MKYLFLILIFLGFYVSVEAQEPPVLTKQDRTSIIESVASQLDQHYIFPDKAKEMGAYLKKRNKEKFYDQIVNYKAFAEVLTKDLQTVHKDLHMKLYYNPKFVQDLRNRNFMKGPAPEILQQQEASARKDNFGFVKVERLPGNIGYLDFRQFYPLSEEAKNTVAAAMGFLANTDAVIVDLRNNRGGDPEMVQLVLSYFMDKTPVHYNSLYTRSDSATRDFYSLAEVEGKKMPATDLYVLTSKRTFSAAEEFTYNLQNLKRATIVGETTGGGAHPTRPYVINDYLVLNIPFERAINPFTKTNWEGTGVTPDVAIEADKALLKARELALLEMKENAADVKDKAAAEWQLQPVRAALNPVQPLGSAISRYAGTYGEAIISYEGGNLFYKRTGRPKVKMIPVTEDLFQLEGMDYFRLKFTKGPDGKVEKLISLYDSGETDESVRQK
ncbi:interphotoreceptor retinoid-binding protein [Flammeovirgaceae bacterium 311]|nr:interphotoreceptor retinoid-binding protein [Flammeovirgaceae bacterium 311]